MRSTLLSFLGVAGILLGLGSAPGMAAESTASPVGLTLDQVLRRYGEPKSQIAAGNRMVLFFPRDRLVLRDGVVVEAERTGSDSAPRRPAAPPAEAAPAPGATPERPPASVPLVAPAAPGSAPVIDGLDPNAPLLPPAPVSAAPVSAAPAAAPSSPPPESKVEIKLVRPPSANYARPPGVAEPAPAPPAEPRSAPAPLSIPAQSGPTTPPPPANANVGRSGSAPVAEPARPAAEAAASTAEPTAGPEKSDPAAGSASDAEARAKEKKAKAAEARRRLMEAAEQPPDLSGTIFTPRTFVIVLLIVGGGIGYLVWRSRQRRLEMEATAVSTSPFVAPEASAPAGEGLFAASLVAKLEWKRFEELVAGYYNKTGVVAQRTKAGPSSPVHIEISWKGEPRPFALVQCIAHPVGLIDEKPLQGLVAALTAKDVRRGYVVSTGKFNVAARDYAEEKHLTLLPGDIFLEKLNALPETARNEIRQAVTAGDYQTPSCPACEAKMTPSPDDPAAWHCASHPEQRMPKRT